MKNPNAAISLNPRLRVGGLVYLIYFLTAVCGQMWMKGLFVSSDSSVVADNIRSHKVLLESGFSLSVIAVGCYLVLIAIFFSWFSEVNRTVSLVATLISALGCAIQLLATTLQSPDLLLQMTTQHFSSLGLLHQISGTLLHVALVFFGAFDVLVGYLILRSSFLPRLLGWWMLIAGWAWLLFLIPPIASAIMLYIEVLGFTAEAALMLWLIVKG